MKMKKLSKLNAAYFAGLFDGDGCVGIDRIKSKSGLFEYNYRMRAIVINSDYEAIKKLKELAGCGCAYKYKNSHNEKWRTVHRWQVVSKNAREFLEQILPYTIIKRNRIKKALSLDIQWGKRGTRGRSEKEYIKQGKVFQELKKMNQRGIPVIEE